MSNCFEPAITPELADPGFSRLLSLFPSAAPLHLPVRVALPHRAKGATKKCTILFGVNDYAILSVDYPLNCGEVVRVRSAAVPGEAPAVVVAMIPKGQGATVAVRFLEGVPKWFRKA
jgi:hypothetical protein